MRTQCCSPAQVGTQLLTGANRACDGTTAGQLPHCYLDTSMYHQYATKLQSTGARKWLRRRKLLEASTASTSLKESETAGFIDGIIADKNHEIQEFEEEYAFTAADSDFRSFTADAAAARRRIRFADVQDEYSNLWVEMAIRREKLPELDSIVERIVRHKEAYRSVERLTRVPWFAIAIIHNLEAGGDFNSHLHNGDPLLARTVHVPAGRPRSGNPPFTWEESAVDALEYDGFAQVTDWSIEHLAYLLRASTAGDIAYTTRM